MITHSDDAPEFEPDDPLAVILRPGSDYLGPPAGRYEVIRRRAARRRLLRAAAGVGATCAVAALVALPLRLAAHEAPLSPTVPLAPPPASSSPSVPPDPTAAPAPATTMPGPTPASPSPSPTAPTTEPDRSPSVTPTPQPSEPSAAIGDGAAGSPPSSAGP
ncbi:hypothetical protein [Streptomyces sp. MMG1533]|uniref:hypothetical protein n=1 Tax=Streptomyces sp. MMG1533 TaxID=1415546 RepID=UPI00099C4713|nr:hypothetical protein [Streptomyces sp. MMG1533]